MADISEPARPAPQGGLLAGGARLRKRRRAELRLKLYGIAAIGVAFLALATLLASVLVQARGAVTESYITLDLDLPAAEIDPGGDRAPAEIRQANLEGLIDTALEGRFPAASGRTELRELHGLVSGGAGFELADRVAANRALIGRSVRVPLVTSDVTDLYLKGGYGELATQDTEGELTVRAGEEEGTVRVSSSAPDFAAALAGVKAGLTDDAERLRIKAGRQDRAVRVFSQRAEDAETEEERAENEALVEERAAKRDELLAQAEALEARAQGAGGAEKLDAEDASALIEVGGGWIKLTRLGEAQAQGRMLAPVALPVEAATRWRIHVVERPEAVRKISDNQIVWIEELREAGQVDRRFNWRFFAAADSRAPELAGIWGAIVGSFWTMLVTFALAFPVGVFGAIYLEEFAPKNRFTDFVEVNVNNLAAVPSIVFGLLGLAVFLGFFGVPRSSPLAGGIVLALMTLPMIIIASRASIRAVPPSIREAALAVGASKLQASFHHVLPLALPGILTGTIIGMAQALGETAPLIMIGMVAFIVEVPDGITDSATVLPVQIFRWSDFPEQAFEAKTGAAICVLLGFLILMNALAIFLRKRFERRW